MTTYLLQAFSLDMFPRHRGWSCRAEPVSAIPTDIQFTPVIGRLPVAKLLARVLGGRPGSYLAVGAFRAVSFAPGDVAYVARYRGPLPLTPDGEPPPGASIEFWRVHIQEP